MAAFINRHIGPRHSEIEPMLKAINASSIEELLKENNTSILAFARFKVGEGIEVEVKDFAAEVAEQLQQ